MKIVHAADLHVDSPLRGLDRYEGAPAERLRGATRRALENLVALCLEVKADVLLLAGDVFDGGWRDFSTGLFFAAQMSRLREAGVPVMLVRGNHDAASAVVKNLQLPANVRVFEHKKAHSVELPNAPIVVHGQSFSERIMSEDLAAKYPPRVPGRFNVGLLHTSIDGREGHAPYAPTSLETLRSKGYDYWALGHVHAREIVSTDPYVVYPGNLQGRHARETGAKGASVVTVEDNVVIEVEHRALDVVRWEVVGVDVAGVSEVMEVVDLVRAALVERGAACDDRILAARVMLTGATRANSAIRRDLERFVSELRAAANDALPDGIWLEKVLVRTTAKIDLDRVRQEESAVGHLARRIEALREDPKELAALAACLVDLDKKLPPELRDDADAPLRFADPEAVRALLADVEQMLVPRLLEGAPGSDG
ncbi:MAG: DNA repair exonuclease [Labilithrix sp.]|nr:DNA repair exonuclease [Labilithrix sp.]MCW5809514.1 DNA repair exonuclease [Labilithrix sp.]